MGIHTLKEDRRPDHSNAKLSIHLKSIRGNSMSTESVGFPKTAYEFLTVVPSGRLIRDEFTIQVGDQDNMALAVAAGK